MDDVLLISIALVGAFTGMYFGQRLRRKRRSNEEATSVVKDTSFLKCVNDVGLGVLIVLTLFTVLYGEPMSLFTREPTSWLRLLSEFIIFSFIIALVTFPIHRWMNRKT
ncbi:hypothetical protein CWE22_10725 [Pseudidiomarina aestuarii]|uniref:Uncharacterized protein n=1 Tax=Pseudidiomarina aestuarii TaxID=624146 RepID=A0A7Z6ZSD3_9GAMM|nr:hypothetical protein [Pseudidiomarina aestuarii]RUO39217.1 hypothetical protein CWE22_10725 [Pseudidiomarina aestuarii]